ncbi:MAG: alkaline phosphatase [Verrucomicrobiales bacterium]|nr:alkaline phosphatase [Verrucomicrobiales bacterium]
MFDRRHFLRISTLAASAGAAKSVAGTPTSTSAAPSPARLGDGAPGRIIHMVADGTSLGTWSCGDQLARLETGRGLAWFELWRRPEAYTCLMDMRSLDSLVTDSAAASSSWGSGSRVRNGVLNVSSTGKPLIPLMALFGEAGWRRGLVTTTEITHATPAGFTVAVDSRGEGETIAKKYLERKLDVFLGGARDHFDPTKRKDKRDLWIQFAAAGYYVAKTKAEFEKAPDDRPWLGTFTSGHLPYSIDQARDKNLQATVPTLREMTDRALAHLERHDHFLLQIEGGRVDHACHNNDAAGALRDLLAFDEALVRVLEFRRQHPDTLVVVTTDHGNANLGLNGIGTSYRDSSHSFRHVARVRASFPEILKRLKAAPSESEAKEILAESTGYKVSSRKLAQFLPFLSGRGTTLFDQMNSDVAALGQLLANHLGIGFVGTTHTSDYVPVAAIGPGADRFRGLIRNVDVFRIFTDLARIDYRNPEERLLADTPANPRAENHAAYAVA